MEVHLLTVGFAVSCFIASTWTEPVKVDENEDVRVVGRCFQQSSSFAFVSLYCGYNRVIEIRQAFHGSHKNPHIAHCGKLRGDCTRDVTYKYDWSSCEGHHSCVQRLHLDVMAICDVNDMQYLQVEYTCVEGRVEHTTKSAASTEGADLYSDSTNGNMSASTDPSATTATSISDAASAVKVREVCSNHSGKAEMLAITSPGYPTHYWSDTDCRCIFQAPGVAQVKVTYYDLGLVQRDDLCVDWLLVQSLGHRVPATVTCGSLADDTRSVTTKGNWALLHFHTAKVSELGEKIPDHRLKKAMSGFKITITAKPSGEFKFQCYTTDPSVLASLKYKDNNGESNNLLLPATDLESLGGTDAPASKLSKNTSSSAAFQHKWTLLAFWIFAHLYKTSLQ